jgi:hypothetical protein
MAYGMGAITVVDAQLAQVLVHPACAESSAQRSHLVEQLFRSEQAPPCATAVSV